MTQFINDLTQETVYDPEKDVNFFSNTKNGCPLVMTPGCFAIFFPQDTHKPLVRHQQNFTKKMVIKIPWEGRLF
jgi:YhcH/YjgK/YiaL family protein